MWTNPESSTFFGRKFLNNWKAVVRRCSVKKVLLEIFQNSQENTCDRDSFLIKLQATRVSFLIKLQACNFIKKRLWRPATLLKKGLCHRCFPVNFEKFLKTPFFTEHLQWLLLIALTAVGSWQNHRPENLSFLSCIYSPQKPQVLAHRSGSRSVLQSIFTLYFKTRHLSDPNTSRQLSKRCRSKNLKVQSCKLKKHW